MGDKLAGVLARPADDPSRFEDLERLLHSPEHRIDFEDYIEEAIRSESGEVAAKMFARARFYAELVEREGEKLLGHEQLDAIQILDREYESILDAASRALRQENEIDLLLPFAKYLAEYLDRTGRWREALSLYERIVDRASAGNDSHLHAQALISYGVLLFGLSKFGEAESILSKAKSISEGAGDIVCTAHATGVLGNIACNLGDYKQALALGEESLRLRREVGRPQGISSGLSNLAIVYCQLNQFERAIHLLKESLMIMREIGDQRNIAVGLNSLGIVHMRLGRYDESYSNHSESDAIFRAVGDRHGQAMSVGNLGCLEVMRRRTSNARKLLTESLELHRAISDDQGVAHSLFNLGCVALLERNFEQAGQFLEQGFELHLRTGEQSQIAYDLSLLALTALELGQQGKAWQHLHESLLISRELKEHNEICMALIVACSLLIEAAGEEAAAIIHFGYQRQVEILGRIMPPISEDCLNGNSQRLRAAIPSNELDRLKAQGESMNFGELIDCAFTALEGMKSELGGIEPDGLTSQLSAGS